MKAAVLVKTGNSDSAFEIQEKELPRPKENQLLIKVEGFGLNYADVMARNGLYNDAPPVPCVLGYEVVGRVEKVGKGTDESWIGKRVTALTRFGGYAEYAVTDVMACAEISEELSVGEAAALCTQYTTAYFAAYEMVNLHEGDKIMLHAAAGGVGIAIIQLAKLKGCKVFAMAGSDEKLEFLKSLGADHVINYRKQDYEAEVNKILNGDKLDVCFNSVTGSTFKKDMRLLSSGGRLVIYGAAERSGSKWGIFSTLNFVRKMGLIIPIGLLMKSKGVIGFNMLSIANDRPHVLKRCMTNVVKLALEGQLKPVVEKEFSAEEIGEAHALFESRNSIGKIALKW